MAKPRFIPRLVLLSVIFLLFSFTLAAGQTLVVQNEIKHDVSAPLRDLVKTAAPVQEGPPEEAEPVRMVPLAPGFKPPDAPDPALQRTTGTAPAGLSPTLNLNVEGIGSATPNFQVAAAPPDTNGAVGLTQYVQFVNLSFAVFDKTTGNMLPNFPTAGKTLWQGFGGPCETNNDGDILAVYDKLNDRWILSQLAVLAPGGGFLTNTLECVAVSTTSDATGSYNRYSFQYNSEFDDYPKMAVWPDGYYFTYNMFSSPPNSFLGAAACALDGNAMRNNQPATQICFQQNANVFSLLPADVDGHTPPPQGSPNFMVSMNVNSIDLYKFHVDFTTPGNSTFTKAANLPVTAFTPFLCNNNTSFTCVPQANTTTLLDSLGDRLMYRLAYRNFGTHESLVVNHSVIANSSSGIRWYEIQNPNGTPVVAQQSTYAPDANFRWMGSIAMDVSGNIALGYSESSSSIFPSIAVTGQAAGDPQNTLQAETMVLSGTGAQIGGLSRWGDYSAMQVDPSDDCTFWYTTEYEKFSGNFNWNTRIANFKFPNCGIADLNITKTHSGNFTQGDTSDTYTITVKNVGSKPTDGTAVTVIDTLPTGLTAKTLSGTGWTCTLGTLTCTRTDVLAANTAYPAITLTVSVASNAPGSVTNTATVSGGGDGNASNNSANDPTTIIQTGPDPTITKTHSGSFIQGQTGTYTITVTNVGLSPTDGTTVTVTDTLPTGLTANSASGTGWTCVLGPPVSCTRSDTLASNASYPPITLTVNVANTAASGINTATVAGGGDTNTLNNTATDPTNVIPPPPDLTITKTHTGNFNQGQTNATYTLTVKNISPSSTTGTVTVTDTLPAGLTLNFINAFGWFCNFTSPITCSRNDVLAGNSSYQPIVLFVNVAGNAAASVVNTATVAGGGEVNTGNDTASDPTTINPSPDLTVALSHAPDPFLVGHTGTYTITVSNVGNAPTSGIVSVSDFLPFGLTVATVGGTGWNCLATAPVTCQRSDPLANGNSYPAITLTVNVVGGGPSVFNTVNVSGGGEFNTNNDSASNTTNVTAPVLAITKSHVGNFILGQTGTYTIVVSNTNVIATSGTVTVTDSLPFSIPVIAAGGTGWGCSNLPSTFVTCTRSDSLPVSSSYPPLTLIVTVNTANGFNSFTNTATVTGGGDGFFHSASDPTIIDAISLSINKSHNGSFTSGQSNNYTISVGNTGNLPTHGTVTMTDNLPAGMTATAVNAPGWNCSTLPTANLTCTRSDSLAGGGNYPNITLTVSVNTTSTFLINTANVTGGGDTVLHSVQDFTNIITGGGGGAPATLTISKSHSGTFALGQTGTYIINVGNSGQGATSGIVDVEDLLPFNLPATAVNAPGWNCSQVPTTFLFCNRSDVLAPGAQYPVITVSVNIVSGGLISNTAFAFGGNATNSPSATDTVSVSAPTLTPTVSHTPDPFIVGQTGTYTINVKNTGATAAVGIVSVTDAMPSGLSIASASGTGWNCSGTTLLTCTRTDSLAVNSSYPPITLTVNVNAGSSSVTNFVNASGGGDPVSHVVSDTANVTAPVLAITKSHTGAFTVGQTGAYTITVSNTGSVPTLGMVTVNDFLPGGMTLNTATGTGWNCSGITFVVCTRSDALAANSSYPALSLSVNIGNTGANVTNSANVSGGGDTGVHTANDPTTINAPVLTITKTHVGDFSVGQPGNYTITVGNTGTGATLGAVTVTDFLPFSLTATAFTGTGWTCSNLPTTFLNCTRSDSLAAGSSYPPLVITVVAGGGGIGIVNTANVSGGGDPSSRSASDPTNVVSPIIAITKAHVGNFVTGQTGTYTLTVSNAGTVATFGTVTVNDSVPMGLTVLGLNASGWNCSFGPSNLNCSRSDSLAAAASYSPISVSVAVGPTAPAGVLNQATASGGGDPVQHIASDLASVSLPDLAIAMSHFGNFLRGQTGTYTITVSNVGTVATAGGTLLITDQMPIGLTAIAASGSGWNCSILPGPQTEMDCSLPAGILSPGSSYPPITLNVGVAIDAPDSIASSVSVFGIGDANFGNNFASDNTSVLYQGFVTDFDADHKADFAIWRPSTGTWWVMRSSDGSFFNQSWGLPGDIPVPGDYDGDGKTDFAIWRPSTGTWWIMRSSDGSFFNRPWGLPGDIPVPGDYDGDGKTDLAIWRPSTGTFWVIRSSDGAIATQQLGVLGDIPVPGDYDGDGKTDYAVWHPSTGTWTVIRSRDGVTVTRDWGLPGDVPVPGDYDGDKKTDFAIWRPSTGTWWVIRSTDQSFFNQPWGLPGDIPVAGDYDGDGKTDLAIWRPSTGTWWIIHSTDGSRVSQQWGLTADIP